MLGHVYQPLPSPRHIRLLDVRPSKWLDSAIECSVSLTSIDTPLEYHALSYSWGMDPDGDITPCRSLTIDGHHMLVAQNLFEGLRRIRSQNGGVRIWIDAVCINQKDMVERSSQVAMMAEIYRSARSTFIWLGEGRANEDDEAHVILERLLSVPLNGTNTRQLRLTVEAFFHSGSGADCTYGTSASNCACGTIHLPFWGKDKVSEQAFLSFDRDDIGSMLKSKLDTSPGLLQVAYSRTAAVQSFFGRRYWRRRWIIQETQFSRHSSVLWGKYSMSAQNFRDLPGIVEGIITIIYLALSNEGFPDAKSGRVKARPSRSAHTWSFLRDVRVNLDIVGSLFVNPLPIPSPVTHAIEKYPSSECSDSRDMIYALLSFDPDFGLQPNYNDSVGQAYTSFATRLIEKNLSPWIFCNLHRRKLDETAASLPSWVPDVREKILDPQLAESTTGLRVIGNGAISTTMWVLGTVSDIDQGNQRFRLCVNNIQDWFTRPHVTGWYKLHQDFHPRTDMDLRLVKPCDMLVSLKNCCRLGHIAVQPLLFIRGMSKWPEDPYDIPRVTIVQSIFAYNVRPERTRTLDLKLFNCHVVTIV